jgi:hypothetical protein
LLDNAELVRDGIYFGKKGMCAQLGIESNVVDD